MDNLDVGVPVDLGHWILAVLPVVALLVYLHGHGAAVKHAWPLILTLGTTLASARC
ncbi:hypothetical protein [Nocardioides nematodiphilus]|uniref:hypothetical protein n=1 Tax=Nocardioides nematodiphilus TaxID=2849669 RepID=UPI001CD99C1D|nr:hypothetical protein [Nocardioides nematodiphilus]MCA1982254.1 hypothetical protein [Nocardioides nematodiphilus]